MKGWTDTWHVDMVSLSNPVYMLWFLVSGGKVWLMFLKAHTHSIIVLFICDWQNNLEWNVHVLCWIRITILMISSSSLEDLELHVHVHRGTGMGKGLPNPVCTCR